MKTINKPNFVAVFVNTNEPAKKVKNLHTYKIVPDFNAKKRVMGLFELTYPHPDAPEYGTVTVTEWLDVDVSQEAIPAFELAINAMQSLSGLVKQPIH